MRGFSTLLALVLIAAAAQAEGIKWAKDWEAARKAAKAQNKPIMIDFYTDWCGWCKRLDKDTFPAAEVVKEAENFVSVKLDAERAGKEVAQKYQVRGYPTIMFVTADGDVVGKIGGYAKPDKFSAEMKKFSTAYQAKSGKPRSDGASSGKDAPGQVDAEAATAQAADGALSEALSSLDRAEKARFKGPAMATAYSAVAALLEKEGKHAEAIAYLKKGLPMAANDDQRVSIQVSIMDCQVAAGETDAAKATAREILKAKNCPPSSAAAARKVLGE